MTHIKIPFYHKVLTQQFPFPLMFLQEQFHKECKVKDGILSQIHILGMIYNLDLFALIFDRSDSSNKVQHHIITYDCKINLTEIQYKLHSHISLIHIMNFKNMSLQQLHFISIFHFQYPHNMNMQNMMLDLQDNHIDHSFLIYFIRRDKL